MMNQVVFDTSRILALKGVRHVVLSPGSRNAPLTISFARNPDIQLYNVVDERSAAFIALGMAQKLKQPVAICCTSGTSLLNYAPAIAEAYYQEIPLIVLSADRPPEWQGQRDGQTIHQYGAIGNFVKGTFQLPDQVTSPEAAWEYQRKLNEGINLAGQIPRGPVHINIPFREPFYPAADQVLTFSEHPRIIAPAILPVTVSCSALREEWKRYDRRLIIIGQHDLNESLNRALNKVSGQAVIIADVISNVSQSKAIRYQDLLLAGLDPKLADSLKPDLIVSIGKSVISKNLKIFLRNHVPRAHWHFDEAMVHADTFQSMTRLIPVKASEFLDQLEDDESGISEFNQQIRKNFIQNWSIEDTKTGIKLSEALNSMPFSEFSAFYQVIQALPADIDLHLANSMPVRYANFIQGLKPGCEVFANRGTSGIDGTNGTAVGSALVAGRLTYLLTGDLSFFYDRNAFFHHYPMNHLRIIVFNNGGGGIFRLIPGPSNLPELEQHFETRHAHSARFTAMEFNFDYFQAKDASGVGQAMKQLKSDTKTPKLLEIFTDPKVNREVYLQVKEMIRQ